LHGGGSARVRKPLIELGPLRPHRLTAAGENQVSNETASASTTTGIPNFSTVGRGAWRRAHRAHSANAKINRSRYCSNIIDGRKCSVKTDFTIQYKSAPTNHLPHRSTLTNIRVATSIRPHAPAALCRFAALLSNRVFSLSSLAASAEILPGHKSPALSRTACGGDTIETGIGHGASARGNFWTTSSSVIPPKKRRESMTENPFSRKMFRK
jgi:hypothetical protein